MAPPPVVFPACGLHLSAMSIVSVYGREFVPAYTAAEAAHLDSVARESAGVPARVLMENAGRSAALIVQHLFPEGRVIAAVGSGNNGGDALVVLRTLAAWGRDVAWFAAGSASPNNELLHGFTIEHLSGDGIAAALAQSAVAIDGILGTGARGAPRDAALHAIDLLNHAYVPVVALDLPSGVDATTGEASESCVHATITITFGAPKIGLMLQPARAACGRLIAVEIAFPPQPDAPATLITPSWAAHTLPARSQDAHKGTSGKLLLVAGKKNMAGAAVIAGRSAIRAGAGLVYIASDESNREVIQRAVPEAIFLDRADETELLDIARKVDALAAGPALGTDDSAYALLRALLSSSNVPVILDADAITLIAKDLTLLASAVRARAVVLTPHPGEMARLVDSDTNAVTHDRVDVARTFALENGCTLLLKGAPSIVATANGHVRISTTGSSDLATAGMGDQLTGTIGGFLASRIEAADAACLGLFFGGRAADLAEKGRSLSPLDVVVRLPRALRNPGRMEPPFGLPFITFDQPPRH